MSGQPEYTIDDYKRFIHTIVDDLEDFGFVKIIYVVSSIRRRKRSCNAASSVSASTIRPETSGVLQSLSASSAVCCSRWRSVKTKIT